MSNKRYTLTKLLTRVTLRQLAGAAAYERGVAYWEHGQVEEVSCQDETLTANVRGTVRYEVQLWIRAGRLQASCSCLAAAEGACCKHCVAVGLQWL